MVKERIKTPAELVALAERHLVIIAAAKVRCQAFIADEPARHAERIAKAQSYIVALDRARDEFAAKLIERQAALGGV